MSMGEFHLCTYIICYCSRALYRANKYTLCLTLLLSPMPIADAAHGSQNSPLIEFRNELRILPNRHCKQPLPTVHTWYVRRNPRQRRLSHVFKDFPIYDRF